MSGFQTSAGSRSRRRCGALGTVITDEDGSKAHLETWKITADGLVKVDPGPWLFR